MYKLSHQKIREQKIFSFENSYQFEQYAHFYECRLNQDIREYLAGMIIPQITIDRETMVMTFRSNQGSCVTNFQLTVDVELA